MVQLTTNTVTKVLQEWANSFVEDVPAVHKNGDYLIKYDALVEHINNLPYDTAAEILMAVEDEVTYGV